MGKESITLRMELAKTQCYEFDVLRIIIHWISARRDVGLTLGRLIPKKHSLYRALKHSIHQHKLDLNLSRTKQPLLIITNSHLNFRYLGFRQLVNTELENRTSSHLTKHSTPARRKKLRSPKKLTWNLYTVWHKVLENTKQANSSSFSTYFMISVTDANLLTHAEK